MYLFSFLRDHGVGSSDHLSILCIFAVLRANIRIISEVHKFVVHKLVYQTDI